MNETAPLLMPPGQEPVSPSPRVSRFSNVVDKTLKVAIVIGSIPTSFTSLIAILGLSKLASFAISCVKTDTPNPNSYAHRKRTVEEKLAYQTECARQEGLKNKNQKKLSGIEIKIDYEKKVSLEGLIAQNIGNKDINEDDWCVNAFILNKVKVEFYGVFDGHRDSGKAASFVSTELPKHLQKKLKGKNLDAPNITHALTDTFMELSPAYRASDVFSGGGTTALCVFKVGDDIYVANSGDSRALLVIIKKEADFQRLSEDATLSNGRFTATYIKRASQEIDIDEESGSLSYSKSAMKNMVTLFVSRDIGLPFLSSKPKITHFKLNPESTSAHYIVMATDGFWDVVTDSEAMQFIQEMHEKQMNAEEMAARLVEGAVSASGHDNVTVGVIPLSSALQDVATHIVE